jgi:hypothetical protein
MFLLEFRSRDQSPSASSPIDSACSPSNSEQSSDDSGSGDDPRQSSAVPNSLSPLQDAYESGSESVVACTPEKKFDEQDGLSDCSDFHTLAQPSKRRNSNSSLLMLSMHLLT